jgi:hypothetical protein
MFFLATSAVLVLSDLYCRGPIASQGVEPCALSSGAFLATLVLSSSNVMKYIQTELVVVLCFCLLLHNTSISAKTRVEVPILGNFDSFFAYFVPLKLSE